MLAPEDVEYIYNGKLLSHKIRWNNAICSNMDEHGGFTLREVSQTERDKHRMTSHMWNTEEWYRWAYLQSRGRVTDIENTLMVPKRTRGCGERWVRSLGSVCTHCCMYTRWHKELLCSEGAVLSILWRPVTGKNPKEYIVAQSCPTAWDPRACTCQAPLKGGGHKELDTTEGLTTRVLLCSFSANLEKDMTP